MSRNRAVRRSALREQAEEWLLARGGDRSTAPQDAARLVHELEIYEIELEMQNDQLRSAQHELEVALQRFTHLFDFAPLAYVVLDPSGVVREANFEAARTLAQDRSRLVGQRLSSFVVASREGALRSFLCRLLVEGDGHDGETCELALHVHGREDREVRLIGSVLSGAEPRALVAMEDVTERKRSEAAAKLMADRLAGAVGSMSHAVALFDSKERLVLCNSAYRAMIGDAVSGELVGRSFQELLDAFLDGVAFPSIQDRQVLRSERLAREREPNATFEVRMRDGRFLRVTDRRTADGGFVKTILDLTADERRARELREARAAAESASAAKSDFLSSVSHELRTPLNAVLGFAQLLMRDKREPLSERHQERVSRILHGGTHLLRLIDDILDLSSIEAGKVSVSVEPVDVALVLVEVRTTLESIAARHGIRIDVDPLPPDVPPLAADRTRFSQILMNFGSNAIKYNRPFGTVRFNVCMPRAGVVRVTVKDTGVGISADKQDTIFQPFQRAGQETGPIQGTGIGLTISKRLARIMGGDVGFRSVPGEGSEFWVDMPARTSHARAIAMLPAADARSASVAPLQQRLLLYVEDSPDSVALMADLVRTFDNVALITAPTAEAGIALARERRPDVIFMDLNLPGMSGIEALRVLRLAPETQGVPIVAVTAAASRVDRERGLEAGFFRYITKPIQVDEVVQVIESLST